MFIVCGLVGRRVDSEPAQLSLKKSTEFVNRCHTSQLCGYENHA